MADTTAINGSQSQLEIDSISNRKDEIRRNKYNSENQYTTPDTSKNVGQIRIS